MRKRELLIWEDAGCFEGGASGGLRGLSFALFFVGDGQNCPVFASRSPTRELAPGVDLCRVLRLDRETRWYLDRGTFPARAVRSPLGVGILSKRFTPTTGMGLYIHFHAPAESVAAILYNRLLPGDYELSDGVEEVGCGMTAADERVLHLIAPVWNELLELGRSFPYGDRDGYVTTDALTAWIGRAASAIGCGLRRVEVSQVPTPLCDSPRSRRGDDIWLDPMPTRSEKLRIRADLDAQFRTLNHQPEPGTVCGDIQTGRESGLPDTITGARWFGGCMWEAYLLYCLLQARMYDPERSLSCVLSTDNGEIDGFLDIAFNFAMAVEEPEDELPPDRQLLVPYPLRAGFACLEQATAYNGSTFVLSVDRPVRAQYDPHTWVFPLTAHLSFLYDVNLELEGDIKTDIELKYD